MHTCSQAFKHTQCSAGSVSLVECEGGKPASSINLIREGMEDEAGGGTLAEDGRTRAVFSQMTNSRQPEFIMS